MANDFSKDNDCVALWRFEAVPGIDQDSIGGNHFTTSSVLSETVFIKEGVQSAKFEKINNRTAIVTDVSLDTGFPFRFNDTDPKVDITLSAWVYLLIAPSTNATDAKIFLKFGGTTRTLRVNISNLNDKVFIDKGYNNGISSESVAHATALVINRWYHISIGYTESDKSYYISIWDDTAEAIHGSDRIGNFAETTSVKNNDLTIGAGSTDAYYDEYVVWNVKKSLTDVDKVRGGLYNYKYERSGRQSINKLLWTGQADGDTIVLTINGVDLTFTHTDAVDGEEKQILKQPLGWVESFAVKSIDGGGLQIFLD